MRGSLPLLLAATGIGLAPGVDAHAATEPRILIVEAESFTTCSLPASCESLGAGFAAGTPQTMAVLVNGVGSLSNATFGIEKPSESTTVNLCGGTYDSSGSSPTLFALIWTPDTGCVTTEGAFIKLMNLRITTTWPGQMAVVENPIHDVVTVTTCDDEILAVAPEHRGVAGISMPSHVPCSDETATQEISWAAVKSLFTKR